LSTILQQKIRYPVAIVPLAATLYEQLHAQKTAGNVTTLHFFSNPVKFKSHTQKMTRKNDTDY
jgi:hypothetical protein